MNPYQIHADGLQELEDEQAEAALLMWYSGAPITILPGGASYKSSNSKGGLTINCDLSLVVLVSAFPTSFDFDAMTNQTFNYPGQNGPLYSVDSVVKAAGSRQVQILANSAAEAL